MAKLFSINTVKEICNQYNFWERTVMPYGFKMTVKELFENWEDYDRCTTDSKDVIRAEVKGFLPILDRWVEYEEEPMVKVRLIEGTYAGEVKEYHKSTADIFIEAGMAVAI